MEWFKYILYISFAIKQLVRWFEPNVFPIIIHILNLLVLFWNIGSTELDFGCKILWIIRNSPVSDFDTPPGWLSVESWFLGNVAIEAEPGGNKKKMFSNLFLFEHLIDISLKATIARIFRQFYPILYSSVLLLTFFLWTLSGVCGVVSPLFWNSCRLELPSILFNPVTYKCKNKSVTKFHWESVLYTKICHVLFNLM